AERAPDTFRNIDRTLLLRVREQYHKLFASVTGREIRWSSNLILNELSGANQTEIAERMAIGIVYFLEIVDVQKQDRERNPLSLGTLVFFGQQFIEVAAIAQLGQLTRRAHFLELNVRLSQSLGTITHHSVQPFIE